MASSALVAASLAGPALAQAPGGLAGFYVGGNVGYSWGTLPVSITTAPFSAGAPISQNFPASSASTAMKLNGWLGGGQIGYNWGAPGWLFGVEADLQSTGEKAYFSSRSSGPLNCFRFSSGVTCSYSNFSDVSAKLSWFGTIRGRFGPEVNGLWMYATAGFAYGRINGSASDAFQYLALDRFTNRLHAASFNSASTFSFSNMNTGWTIGGGIEGRIGTSNWSWKIEYLHIDLGPVGTALYGITPPVTVNLGHFTDDILRVGLNFGFRP